MYLVWWVIVAAQGGAYSEWFCLGPVLPSSFEQVWPEEATLPDLSVPSLFFAEKPFCLQGEAKVVSVPLPPSSSPGLLPWWAVVFPREVVDGEGWSVPCEAVCSPAGLRKGQPVYPWWLGSPPWAKREWECEVPQQRAGGPWCRCHAPGHGPLL